MSKAVTKKEDNLPSAIEDEIFATAGEGTSYDTSELQIPFVRILQAMSPQLTKSNPKYIPNARAGDIFNTVSNQVWDGEEGIVVIPCKYGEEASILTHDPKMNHENLVKMFLKEARSSLINKSRKFFTSSRCLKFANCFRFYLSDSLSRHLEDMTNFFERVTIAITKTVSEFNNFPFSVREAFKNF